MFSLLALIGFTLSWKKKKNKDFVALTSNVFFKHWQYKILPAVHALNNVCQICILIFQIEPISIQYDQSKRTIKKNNIQRAKSLPLYCSLFLSFYPFSLLHLQGAIQTNNSDLAKNNNTHHLCSCFPNILACYNHVNLHHLYHESERTHLININGLLFSLSLFLFLFLFFSHFFFCFSFLPFFSFLPTHCLLFMVCHPLSLPRSRSPSFLFCDLSLSLFLFYSYVNKVSLTLEKSFNSLYCVLEQWLE